jgi:hypothetical protein
MEFVNVLPHDSDGRPLDDFVAKSMSELLTQSKKLGKNKGCINRIKSISATVAYELASEPAPKGSLVSGLC